MAFSVTQPNFTGKSAGGYISSALKEAKSLEYLTVLENIKYKENIQKMDGSGLVKNSDCNAFTSAGDLSLTEATLEPKSLQINLAICKGTLLTSYEALQMRAGRDAMPSVSFEDYVISYIGEIIADATEKSIWRGVATNNGEFNGFCGFTLLPANDNTVVQSSASGAYTAGNIVAELQTLTADILGGTAQDVLHKDDAYIFMNRKTYQFYIQAMSTLNYMNMSQMNNDYQPYFEGIKIAVVDGMIDNQLVFAESSNLFFGTDLLSDHTRISLLDQSVVTGSDNINLVARYTAGVIQGIGANVVRQS
ncbi:MAG: hypothetical protein Unbinned4026contig1003_26 [Prokaryotic dsDNA virus sp.]|nr:MAG: hypothetical protein Unbinned4026contig1003_26 [Prokaryotic dsDNA virus sp.]|tara:strand:- start:12127 stop:13044 length:918 start_codon:yes stop_codon:yes gene_type:complete